MNLNSQPIPTTGGLGLVALEFAGPCRFPGSAGVNPAVVIHQLVAGAKDMPVQDRCRSAR